MTETLTLTATQAEAYAQALGLAETVHVLTVDPEDLRPGDHVLRVAVPGHTWGPEGVHPGWQVDHVDPERSGTQEAYVALSVGWAAVPWEATVLVARDLTPDATALGLALAEDHATYVAEVFRDAHPEDLAYALAEEDPWPLLGDVAPFSGEGGYPYLSDVAETLGLDVDTTGEALSALLDVAEEAHATRLAALTLTALAAHLSA